MSARLVSRKPRPYASFVAVSISRVRLSGCAVRIFSDSDGVSYLTNSYHKPDPPLLSTPATRQCGRARTLAPLSCARILSLYGRGANQLGHKGTETGDGVESGAGWHQLHPRCLRFRGHQPARPPRSCSPPRWTPRTEDRNSIAGRREPATPFRAVLRRHTAGG